jgi:U3 small nucleolar RNA-associated protein 15
VWDILTGRILQAVSAHSKTITSLCRDSSATHLFSASLDRSVKAYELATGKVIGAIKYDAPLLCLALSPQSTHLVGGTSDGTLTVRRRRIAADANDVSSAPADPLALTSFGRPGQVVASVGAEGARPGTYRYFLRGRGHTSQPGDVVARAARPPKLAGFDKALKRFRYHDALDAALLDGSPEVVVSVVEELVQRNGLRIALQGRDQQTLQPLVSFLARQIISPPFAPTLIGVANLLLNMYAPVLGQSARIDELFVKLRNTLEAEMRLQAELAQLLGAMDVLLAGAAHAGADAPPPKKAPRLAAATPSSSAADGATPTGSSGPK